MHDTKETKISPFYSIFVGNLFCKQNWRNCPKIYNLSYFSLLKMNMKYENFLLVHFKIESAYMRKFGTCLFMGHLLFSHVVDTFASSRRKYCLFHNFVYLWKKSAIPWRKLQFRLDDKFSGTNCNQYRLYR